MTVLPYSLHVQDVFINRPCEDLKSLYNATHLPAVRQWQCLTPCKCLDYTLCCQTVAAPLAAIRHHQKHSVAHNSKLQCEMITGEAHYFQGKRYELAIIERPGCKQVCVANQNTLMLYVPPETAENSRWQTLEQWYRRQMRKLVSELLTIWEPVIKKKVAEYRIKRMKTLWGSCNVDKRRIWLNLELIHKPHACLEYILVHEMIHLLELHHTARFFKLMDHFMPDWHRRSDILNNNALITRNHTD